MRTIEWSEETGSVKLVDQTLLPKEFKVIECSKLKDLTIAIKELKVRGAPALGAAGGYGVALSAFESKSEELDDLLIDISKSSEILKGTRPTAVNLFYGVDRVLAKAKTGKSVEEVRRLTLAEADVIAEEDIIINKKLGENGALLLEEGDTVMTHCNAGKMACVDWGTALGVIRSAIALNKKIDVISCETRPLNQGSRITTWELMEDKIPVRLITDSASGHAMRMGMVDKIIVGADRIVRDAVFNKIGTYTHAVLAKKHDIPFYVAAPISTFDLEKEEKDVIIEERSADELLYFNGVQNAPLDAEVYNPAFDATPMELVSAIITEKGVIYPSEGNLSSQDLF
ncbi:MAG: S-methyl-5-thioribose-1-phosphate isomerase [Halobacteriota archaeon]|nr:S-methyl-5-thioribose-1-phosphate isomerase [Halobacteriota archaeon]